MAVGLFCPGSRAETKQRGAIILIAGRLEDLHGECAADRRIASANDIDAARGKRLYAN